MTCGHCKDCKWWEEHAEDWQPQGWGKCSLAFSQDHRMMTKTTLAFAVTGGRAHASLVTHNDFGCVQWEAK